MKKKLNVGVVVTLSGRWPRELPEKRFKEYGEWTINAFPECNVVSFDRVVCTKEDMEECIDSFKKQEVELLIMVYGAFTGDDICCGFADALSVPIILWAPREEEWVREDRLYANALCCAAMNGASLMRIHAPHHIVFGNKEEERAATEVKNLVTAYEAVKNIKGLTFGLFGYRPTAFYNCAFDEVVLRRTFGINVEETDLKVVFDRMEELPEEVVKEEQEKAEKLWNTTEVPEGHMENHARLYLVLKELMKEQKYDYATIKCWPEMGNLHTTPCAVLGRLMDEGVSIGCEGDVDAGIAALVQDVLTDKPTFITDLINLDEKENTVTFWHCGNAAPSLHNQKDGVKMCNHPLLGQGTAFWCSLKEGSITAARFTNIDGVYRLFLLKGTAVPTVRNTRGAMVNVKIDTPVLELVKEIAEQGMSHHYSLVWEDVAEQMELVANLLHIPVIKL